MPVEHIQVGPEVRFAAPGGLIVLAQDVSMDADYQGETLSSLVVHIRVAWETWLQIDEGAWFNLAPERRGPIFAGGFDPEKPVELELRLASSELTTLALVTDDCWDIGGLLRGDNLVRSFKSERSWYALNVKQVIGPLKAGFATTWSESD